MIRLALLSLLLMGACSSPQSSVQDPNVQSDFSYQADKDQILFFNLTIQKVTATQKDPIQIVQTIVSDGKIKKDFGSKADYRPYQLLCSFLDTEQTLLKQTAIAHPLFRRYEYLGEDGQMTSKMVTAESGQFTLRTQLTAGIHYLKVEEILENGPPQLLQILKLQ
ncbi:MAG: hypothetical protein AAGD05_03940 [Bacteroidota bacterium]